MNDDFLTRMRKPPRREFADELYRRISKPMIEQRSSNNLFQFHRAALAFAVLVLLLLLTVLVSPSARAFAEDQFRQIGALIFRQANVDSALQEAAPSPEPTTAAPGDADQPQNTTLMEDASSLAGFTVLSPSYLPEGYQAATIWSIDQRESGIYVVSTFRDTVKNQFLLLNQIQYAFGASFEQTIGENEKLFDINVSGREGVWITGRLMNDPTDHTFVQQEEPALYATNWLVWQEGDITYTLIGNSLSQEEMITIAESLGQ